jgi:hypothetical protein
MWLGILLILGGALYLVWCLVAGKIVVTIGTDLRKKTSLVERQTSPMTFWIAWLGLAGALVIFSIFLIRAAMGGSS